MHKHSARTNERNGSLLLATAVSDVSSASDEPYIINHWGHVVGKNQPMGACGWQEIHGMEACDWSLLCCVFFSLFAIAARRQRTDEKKTAPRRGFAPAGSGIPVFSTQTSSEIILKIKSTANMVVFMYIYYV